MSDTERTDQGEQYLIDGVRPVAERERAQARCDAPKRGGNRPLDFGLFDDGAQRQTDLMDFCK